MSDSPEINPVDKTSIEEEDLRSLPLEISKFKEKEISTPKTTLTVAQWRSGLRQTEIEDNIQRLRARPWIAWGVGLLLILQSIGIWFIIVWSIQSGQLKNLQLIFSALIGGTLTESYFLLKLIVRQIFGDINYHNSENNNDNE